MEYLLAPLSVLGVVFITAPFVALLLGGMFAAVYCLRRRWTILLAALLWLLYGGYEYGMKLRLLCAGECNIRLDLMLIYPVLVAMSLWAVVTAVRGRKNGG